MSSAYIDGQPVTIWREDAEIYVSFDPWCNWGHGLTLEEALDDLIDSCREIGLGPWEREMA